MPLDELPVHDIPALSGNNAPVREENVFDNLTVIGQVPSDLNGDGIFNPATESGVEGVDVELWYDTTSTTPAATTQTQSDGSYSFSVAPGWRSI